jgi:carboxyl-terminal processing protease
MRPWFFKRARRLAALAAGVLLLGTGPARPAALPAVSLLDLIDVEFGHTTIVDNYDQPVSLQRLLDGARTGIVAYLVERGIDDPQVGMMHARSDGRGAVPAIEQQIGRAIERYGARVVPRDLVYAAIRGELAALHDPYSVFFTAPEVKSFSAAIDGSAFGGVGIALAFDDATKTWRADTVFAGSPAARAGVQAGDVLAAVDGVPVETVPTAGIAPLLRGKIGTVVQLTIVRDGTPLAAPLAVTRAAITPPDVIAHELDGHIGYVALRSFPLDAATQLADAMHRLAARGARAYVLDLRGNGGGYESAAAQVASLFIPSGPVVTNEARGGKRTVTMADGRALPPAPLVVLVDGNSASGAELVAAAIQDRHLGQLVGTRTFGKGLVQTMFPLPDGSAIKLTTARYFTAGGRYIDRIGVLPNVVVTQPSDARTGVPGADPQLDRALGLLTAGGVT